MSQPHQVSVETPELDRFLAGDVPLVRGELDVELHFSPEERRARLALVFRGTDDPPAELLPQRVLACWRLARATTAALGTCADDEPLEVATDVDPDPWTHPTKPHLGNRDQLVLRRGDAGRLASLFAQGVTLLPPRYEDGADKVQRWCDAMAVVSQVLGISATPRGRAALRHLLDPTTAPACGVTPALVLELEAILIGEAQRLVIEASERSAVAHFRGTYSLSRGEVLGLMRLAKAETLRQAASSVEEDRAIMVARLQDYHARAKETMNMADELKALKELARVQGLTRSDPEDRAAEFLGVISAVAVRQDAQRREIEAPRTIQALPPAEVVDYELQDDADAEALRQYDEETSKR